MYIPVRTSMYQYIPVHTTTSSYHFIPVRTGMYQYMPVYTRMDWYVLVCAGIYWYILLSFTCCSCAEGLQCVQDTIVVIPPYPYNITEDIADVPFKDCWYASPQLFFQCYLRPSGGRLPKNP